MTLLLAGLSLFVTWRVLYFRPTPDLLYQAIPDATVFLSEHADFSSRWKTIFKNPAIYGVAEIFGAKHRTISGLVENEATQMILDRFGSERVLLGYASELRPRGDAALVLASWVGMEGQLLRWGIYDWMLDDFERIRFRNGRSGWIMPDVEVFGELQVLSVAVSEGVLLACLSRDPEGVQYLVRRLERSRTLAPAARALQEGGYPQATTPDRGWVRFFPSHTPIGSPSGWHFGIRFDEQSRIAGSVRGPIIPPYKGTSPWSWVNAFSSSHDARIPEELTTLNKVLGPAPGILAVLPFAYGKASLSGAGRMANQLVDVLSTHLVEDALMFTSMTTPAFGGTVLEVPLPALMLGVQLQAPEQGPPLVGALLDVLNAEYGWGLIRRQSSDAPSSVTAIDSVTQKSLRQSLQGISPAYSVIGNWLVLSTSQEGLESLVAHLNNPADVEDVTRWSGEVPQIPGDVVGWVDLASTSTATRKLIGVYDLWMIWKGLSRETELRQNLALFDRFMLHVQDMQSFCLWSDLDETRCEFKFLLGGKEPG